MLVRKQSAVGHAAAYARGPADAVQLARLAASWQMSTAVPVLGSTYARPSYILTARTPAVSRLVPLAAGAKVLAQSTRLKSEALMLQIVTPLTCPWLATYTRSPNTAMPSGRSKLAPGAALPSAALTP